MKKIILILFLFVSCFLIYNLTEEDSTSILVIGDSISNNQYLKGSNLKIEYNNDYIDKDYRIIDLINVIKYNQKINDKEISIHRLMKNADIVILSVGMNDIYFKINDNTKNIYTYINTMLNNMEILLTEINKYKYKQVFVLGYYNITNNNNDIFVYLDYKMKRITKKYNYEYIELNKILRHNINFYKNSHNFDLNTQGYNEINKIMVEKLKKY